MGIFQIYRASHHIARTAQSAAQKQVNAPSSKIRVYV
jgi:hypothetical protein